MQITVLGSLNVDLVTTTLRVPGPGETSHSQSFSINVGGKGLNQAVAAHRLSSSKTAVRLIGRVGDDAFGHTITQFLQQEHMDTSGITTLKSTESGVANIIVEQETGENRILFNFGANGSWRPADVEDLQFGDFLVLQDEVPLDVVWTAMRRARQSNCKTVWNPSPYPDEGLGEGHALDCVDYLVVNEGEAASLLHDLCGKQVRIDDTTLLQTLADTTRCRCIVVTLGAKGAVYWEKDVVGQVQAVKVDKVVDTTGAGDTLLGAFVARLADGESVQDALQFSVRAAALTVSRPGAAKSMPRLEELQRIV